MRLTSRVLPLAVASIALVALVGTALGAYFDDWGLDRQTQMENKSQTLFGFGQPLTESSSVNLSQAQALANPAGLITVAKGLKVGVVSAGNAAPNIDQMILWPKSDPTYIIGCNEEGTTEPTLQRISLATGVATTIATGLGECDPVRATPWGTVLFGSEGGSTGAMYELIDPLNVTGASINPTTGVTAAPYTNNIKRVNAFGFLSFEGLALLPSGVTYYGDELGPSNGTPGGAYYKFIPSTPWTGSGSITSLDQSPYNAGNIYSLRVGQGSNSGQGDAYGIGTWSFLASLNSASNQQLRALATANNRTGYYRPEDISIDEAALAAGSVRFCGNDTGRDAASYWGETVCFTDGTVAGATSPTTVPQVQLFVQGSQQFNMPDNVAYQPDRGNWVINEDGSTDAVNGNLNNDIWDCLPDGADVDTLSDGCVRVAVLNDTDAESTGGFFDPSGKHYYVSIQHNSSAFGTILDVTGWGSQGN
jgi:hypothetical protein